MSSEKQIQANRRNSQKSTGPKSAAGKSVVRLNAVKHGAMAETVVIPFMESEEEWEEHRRGVLESIAPVGHVESALADRVAELLWRLRRVARYEREIVANKQEAVEERILYYEFDAISLEHLRRDSENTRATVSLLKRLPRLGKNAEIPASVAMPLIDAAARKVKGFDLSGLRLPEDSEGTVYDFASWYADDLRWVITAIAERAGTSLEGMLEAASFEVHYIAVKAELELKKGVKLVGRARRKALLPGQHETDKISRYEAHLDRSLYKALHELQRLQAMRLGREAPLPVAVDVNGT